MPFVEWMNKNQAKEATRNVPGHQWEKASGGQCLFLFAVAQDEDGRSVQRQIADKIG